MKIKLVTLFCVLVVGLCSVHTSRADDNMLEAVADVAVVRPASLAVTIFGAAVFVVALPVAAVSRSVKKTAHILVGHPARFTFTRHVGDFSNTAAD
jgi:hypothetical protein